MPVKSAALVHTPHRSAHSSKLSHLLLFSLALFTLFIAVQATFPSTAWAKDFKMPQVDIVADMQSDGSLHVVEKRTFDFDGSFSAIWWTFNSGNITVNSMSMTKTTQWTSGPETSTVELSEVPFQTSWRNEGGPGKEAYSVDSVKNTVYAFFFATNEQRTITIDYTVVDTVAVYDDGVDLYWQFVGDGWSEASSNVTCKINLPAPAGIAAQPGSDVYAWGHGPASGTVSFNDDGTSLTYAISKVPSGSFAEARVVFPRAWLVDLPQNYANYHPGVSHLDQVKEEEEKWANEANLGRALNIAFIAGVVLLCVLALLIAWRLYLRYGKEFKPTFTDKYWRDVPDKEVHPAVIARLWKMGKTNNSELTATIMHLANEGAVIIARGTYPNAKGKEVEDFYLTRVPAKVEQLADPIDRKVIEFLFDKIAQGEDALWLGTIKQYGLDNPSAYDKQIRSWRGLVTAETNRQEYFEQSHKGTLTALRGFVVIAAFGASFVTGNFIPLICAVPTAFIIFIISSKMERRTQKGTDTYARCKALRNWLKDFSAIDERPPTDVKVWGEFMVYAYLFGVATETIAQLRAAFPEMFAEAETGSDSSLNWYTTWYAYNAGAHGGSAADSFTSAFDTMVSNTESVVSSALSPSSSGGGFGGGFSGGGGGGFGGGGGGAR